VSHSGRLTYEYEANLDLHHRQNALPQLLLDNALLWNAANADVPALKAHLKHMAQLAFDIARASEDQ